MVRADVDVVECALAEVVLAEAKHVVLVARVRISFFHSEHADGERQRLRRRSESHWKGGAIVRWRQVGTSFLVYRRRGSQDLSREKKGSALGLSRAGVCSR